MFKHIVLWKLKDEAHGNSKEENAAKLKRLVEELNGKIPGLIHVEVGINCNRTGSPDESDVALYSEFDDKKAFEDYVIHPEHQKILPFSTSIFTDKRVIDLEVTHA